MVMELGIIPPDAATGLNYRLEKSAFPRTCKGRRVRTYAREPRFCRAAERRQMLLRPSQKRRLAYGVIKLAASVTDVRFPGV